MDRQAYKQQLDQLPIEHTMARYTVKILCADAKVATASIRAQGSARAELAAMKMGKLITNKQPLHAQAQPLGA